MAYGPKKKKEKLDGMKIIKYHINNNMIESRFESKIMKNKLLK